MEINLRIASSAAGRDFALWPQLRLNILGCMTKRCVGPLKVLTTQDFFWSLIVSKPNIYHESANRNEDTNLIFSLTQTYDKENIVHGTRTLWLRLWLPFHIRQSWRYISTCQRVQELGCASWKDKAETLRSIKIRGRDQKRNLDG